MTDNTEAGRRVGQVECIVKRLREAVTDWNGAQMVDGEPARDVLRCGDFREAADTIERLRALLYSLVNECMGAEHCISCSGGVWRDGQHDDNCLVVKTGAACGNTGSGNPVGPEGLNSAPKHD